MQLYFDEDMGTGLPKALRVGLAPAEVMWPRKRGGLVQKGSKDVDWLRTIGSRWLVLSHDVNMMADIGERLAIIRWGVGIVFVTPHDIPSFQKLRLILRHWPWLVRLYRSEERPFAYQLTASGRRVKLDLELERRPEHALDLRTWEGTSTI